MYTHKSENLKHSSLLEHQSQGSKLRMGARMRGISQEWQASILGQRSTGIQDFAAEYEISIPPAPQMLSSAAYLIYFCLHAAFLERTNMNAEEI